VALLPATAEARRLAGNATATAAPTEPADDAAVPPPRSPYPDPPFPRTRNVYVEFKVAHPASYMALEGRADKLARLVRDAAAVEPGQRVEVAAVDGSGGGGSAPPPAAVAAGSSGARAASAPADADAGAATLTYGAVVFNDEAGAAEREVAAVAAPGALERVAEGARAFGVAVVELAARFSGSSRRRRRMLLEAR
jgi:hypothetical protein